MNIKGMEVYFTSDLKDYGRTEDGTPFIGEVFFIEVENKRGDRWRLNQYFDGVKIEDGEDGTYYQDNRIRARGRCDRLVEAIANKGRIDLAHWHQARCAYGSQAYLEYGQAEDLALERMEG